MERIAFHQLPLWVRLAAAMTLFNTWVVIAEYVIDGYRHDGRPSHRAPPRRRGERMQA
jgi:hypothetical protein